MRKHYSIILLLVSILFLVSCQNEGSSQGTVILEDRDNQLADACIDTFYYAVQNKNTDGIKDVFSNRACADAGNMETQVNELFEFIKGDLYTLCFSRIILWMKLTLTTREYILCLFSESATNIGWKGP